MKMMMEPTKARRKLENLMEFMSLKDFEIAEYNACCATLVSVNSN